MSDDERARLEAAGLVAPIVRGMDETTLRRRVHTYDRETGEPVREVTVRQLIGGLAKVTALEVEVIEGKRPTEVPCERCGKPVAVAKVGGIPRFCLSNLGGCFRQTVCPCGCGRTPPKQAFDPWQLAARRGGPWVCTAEAARRAHACKTQEQRSEEAIRRLAAMAPEKRSAAARAGGVASSRKRWSGHDADEHRARQSICMTADQRSAAALKSWATRRAKAASVLPSSEDGLPQKTEPDD